MGDLENEDGKAAPATDERIGIDQTIDAYLYFATTYVVNVGAAVPIMNVERNKRGDNAQCAVRVCRIAAATLGC